MKKEIVIVLDNVRSALNVGSIFRTCDCLGIKQIYLVGITPTPKHPKVAKTAIGAENFVEWKHFKTIDLAINYLKDQSYEIYSVEQSDKSEEFNTVSYPQKLALVFGHEITGVSLEAMNLSEKIVEIPMYGNKKSLNISLSVGIVLSYLVYSN